MLGRLASSYVFATVGAAYFVDMFLRWTPPSGLRTTGWDTGVTSLGGVTALGLLLVELTAMLGVWRSRVQRLLGFYLGWIYLTSDNLLGPILAHALYDFVVLVYVVRRPLSANRPENA